MMLPPPQSPLKHGLVFKKKIVNALFRMVDFFIPRSRAEIPLKPKKILICHFGNIGDIFIASRAIEAVKQTYPEAQVNFLVTPQTKGLFERPHVCKAALHWWRELRAEKYCMAIDLHPYFPNAVPLMYAARIPVRMGYGSGGFGSSLTHPFEWKEFGKYLGELHLDHLGMVGDVTPSVEALNIPVPETFVVIHMCSSRQEKDWNRDAWIQLINQLGCPVVLTGRGEKDRVECEAVSTATGCLDLCNQLSIGQYGALLKRSKGLVSVDSMGVHLAALHKVPVLVLYMEMNFPHLWLPPGALFLCPNVDGIDKIVACTQSF